jgi:hypothetical protein
MYVAPERIAVALTTPAQGFAPRLAWAFVSGGSAIGAVIYYTALLAELALDLIGAVDVSRVRQQSLCKPPQETPLAYACGYSPPFRVAW